MRQKMGRHLSRQFTYVTAMSRSPLKMSVQTGLEYSHRFSDKECFYMSTDRIETNATQLLTHTENNFGNIADSSLSRFRQAMQGMGRGSDQANAALPYMLLASA